MRQMLLFSDRAKRDARAKELLAQGRKVHRSTSKNQQIHPMYIEDLAANVSEADKGFGNTIYKTFFATLYKIEVE
jgi:hypothetical protein